MSRDICEVEEVIFSIFTFVNEVGDPNLADIQFSGRGGYVFGCNFFLQILEHFPVTLPPPPPTPPPPPHREEIGW